MTRDNAERDREPLGRAAIAPASRMKEPEEPSAERRPGGERERPEEGREPGDGPEAKHEERG